MDFVEAKHAAAREIALAFGVPPMLLGLPGDNTFANYAEANRSFWRQTVLPLVGRTAQSLAAWLAPDEPGLRLQPDLDRIDALAAERGELWSRIGAASFLTDDEKRAAVGYGAAAGGAVKYSPDQPRVPAGNSDGGQWTSGGGGGGSANRVAQTVGGGLGDTISAVATEIDRILSGSNSSAAEAVSGIKVAGGFEGDDLSLSVQKFISLRCVGAINREVPGQFLSMPLSDLLQLGASGNAAARKCIKVLKQDRFRK